MEKSQLSTIEDVIVSRRGYCLKGTLVLSTHHLVFKFDQREIWICYPMIENINKKRGSSLLYHKNNQLIASTYNPNDNSLAKTFPNSSYDHYLGSHIRIQCKDFTFYSFDFTNDLICCDVFQKLSMLITLPKALNDITSFYAYNYSPNSLEMQLPEKGWDIYDPIKEYTRLGLISATETYWRLTTLNQDYKLCSTYPSTIIVPEQISDNVIKHASKFRSKQRIPAVVYKHRLNTNRNIIARCSQPLVGLNLQNRSIQDEKLISEIFNSQQRERLDNIEDGDGMAEQPQKNLIVDLRPITNAMAQHALGAGTESIDNYRDLVSTKVKKNQLRSVNKIFCNIDNIHVMRDSLNKVTTALNALDDFPLSLKADDTQVSYSLLQQALSKSQWLHRLSIILQSVDRIIKSVHLNNTNVLIHCSDGWDRTSQVSALLQLCLDPYYRTLEGFMVLIEKEWVSFGFKFNIRADHGGCIGASIPKLLQEFNDFNDNGDNSNGGARGMASFLHRAANKAASHIKNGATAAANAAANAANNVTNVTSNPTIPSTITSISDSNSQPIEPSWVAEQETDLPSASISDIETTDPNEKGYLGRTYNGSNEKSPIFHQFLDAVYQIHRQHCQMFEFNTRFLKRLFYHYYSCQYGTFLSDTEQQVTQIHNMSQHTVSVWDYFRSRPQEFVNSKFQATADVVFFNYNDVKWWSELYGRSDEEMNGLSNSLDRKLAKMNLQTQNA